MSTPTDVPVFPVGHNSPAARAARAEHLHRRLQLEHAYLTRARQEWLHTRQPREIACMRAAYILARGARAIAAHDATWPGAPVLEAVTSEVAA